MSLRLLLGWIIAIVGLLVILALFGIGFGIHGPFGTPLENGICGLVMIAIGVALASGRSPVTG